MNDYVEYCDLCGQRLTDASGKWSISLVDHGIFHWPPIKGKCCDCCHDKVFETIEEMLKKRRKDIDI